MTLPSQHVLANRSLFGLLIVYQHGQFGDVRQRIHAINEAYVWDPDDMCYRHRATGSFHAAAALGLRLMGPDHRFPLHLLVHKGHTAALISRVLVNRPEWRTVDVLRCAVGANQLHLVELLAPQFESMQLNLLAACSASGSVDMAHCLVQHGHTSDIAAAMEAAARAGHTIMFKYLASLGEMSALNATRCVDSAAANGHVDILKVLATHSHTWRCTTLAMDQAAANGHLEVVQFCHDRNQACTTDAIDMAANNGHLDIVKFLHRNRTEGWTPDGMDYAAMEGHIAVVRYLYANRTCDCTTSCRCTCTTDAIDGAAANGHFTTVVFLVVNLGMHCTTRAVDDAATNGHMEIVRFLLTMYNGQLGCTTRALDGAATNGHVEVVKLLLAHQAKCTTRALTGAVGHGHLEVVQLVYAYFGPKWIDPVDATAAANGHVPVLMWLYMVAHIEPSHLAWTKAVHHGQFAAMKYLYGLHPDTCDVATTPCDRVDVIRWLARVRGSPVTMPRHVSVATLEAVFASPSDASSPWPLQTPSDATMHDAIVANQVDKVAFLHHHFCAHVCGPDAMDTAVACGHLHLVQYLHAHCPRTWTTAAALTAAATQHDVGLTRFLCEQSDRRGASTAECRAHM
ncbi:Aste57867_16042 [Aphanomyces stellatus]|uniref:Aste57867_16042 protein n=1 Tax=Aphanomyces stellatus TaxID=120398 RepID=A0A485L4U6_9STRA|nr:hypothetical protein As57867_015986 [Aphanomyces stellatus]VFT92826.1 Aste57867_16042 [Aphanomyces stellatus]